MLNYREWLQRARDFLVHIGHLPGMKCEWSDDGPLSIVELGVFEKSLRLTLPSVIRSFLLEGSSGVSLGYFWEPPAEYHERLSNVFRGKKFLPGGAVFCNANEMHGQQLGCWDTGNFMQQERRCSSDSFLWLRSFPFLEVGNGDYLALDVMVCRNDPPVVYLCHDAVDISRPIFSTFDEFLVAWEKLLYINPAIWLLDEFRDSNNGFIQTDGNKAKLLKELFRPIES